MPVIKAQGTTEQVEKWYNAAKRHAIIGCYAQTELRYETERWPQATSNSIL
jgi:acyl-CoA oxidase